jgi:LmbE family N-acetylglucosaminyl deacetylase
VTAAVFDPRGPVCLVSPHLDDVVLSCGHFLARAAQAAGGSVPPPIVVTVLAGAPEVLHDGYNRRTTGERFAPAAVARRREEDAAALGSLGARPHWMELWDGDFRDGVPEEEGTIAAAVRAALAELAPASVVFPLGYSHPDHVAVGNACAALAGDPSVDWYLYADRPYTLGFPGGVEDRVNQVRAGLRIEELAPVPPAGRAKQEAFKLYATQYLPVSGELPGYAETIAGPERYWKVVPAG